MRAEGGKGILLLRQAAPFRRADIAAQQLAALDAAVQGFKALQELLPEPVGILLPGRGIRPAGKTKGHQCPGHRTTDLAAAGDPPAKRGGNFKHGALVHVQAGGKGRKNRLGAVELAVKKGGCDSGGIFLRKHLSLD